MSTSANARDAGDSGRDLSLDPADSELMDDPYERYAALRAECPVAPSLDPFRFVSRHADVAEALRDHRTFSVALGMRVHGQELADEELSINEIDPPRHSRLRRLMISVFSPAAVAEVEPFVAKLAAELLDGILVDGAADLVEAFNIPLPTRVIAHMLGIPEDDLPDFKRWSDDIVVYGPQGREAIPSLPEFNAYVDERIAERLAADDPSDDLITRMAVAEADGERLTPVEVRSQIRFLLLAGNETTTNLLGNVVYELLERGLWSRLVEDRALVPTATEEGLRFASPAQFTPRNCQADTRLGDVEVPAGQRLFLGLGSANRDERVWTEPEEFSLDREGDNPHLAFGLGIHMCIGAALARMETRIALEALLDRMPGLALAEGFEYRRVEPMMMRGPRTLDVTW